MLGGLAKRDYAGALVHRDEIPNKAAVQGSERFVLAQLSGWSEKQLRDQHARIRVSRNQAGPEAELSAANSTAQLLQFDEQTGIAVLTYTDRFDYSLDAGFRVDRSASSSEPSSVLRTNAGLGSGPGGDAWPGWSPPYSVDMGTFLPGHQGAAGKIELASTGPEQGNDTVHLAVRADKLVGFVRTEQSGAAVLTPVGNVQIQVQGLTVKPSGVVFGRVRDTNIPVSIETDLVVKGMDRTRLWLKVLESPSAAAVQAATGAAKEVYEPVETNNTPEIFRDNKLPGRWNTTLEAPANDGEERTYLLQLAWAFFRRTQEPSAYGRPFVVKLRNRGGKIEPVVEGLPNLNAALPAPTPPLATFPLEAQVIDLHEIAGGREVLMQLDGPPYWKRFSLTRSEWLPMPPGNLSDVHVTGNLTSLFVLDRGAASVRKYNLADLQPQGNAKLPTGIDYAAILSGCNTERAPVHVLSNKGAISLDPENLQRRDLHKQLYTRLDGERELNVSKENRFAISGDGLAITVRRGEYSSSLHYCDDAFGLRSKFFDVKDYRAGEWGVSGAFVLHADRSAEWLSTVALPNGGAERPVAAPKAAESCPRWLLPNSPVIVRMRSADEQETPPQEIRLELFSYFDETPFAEVQVPECDPARDEDGSVFHHYFEKTRWVSFDPYSLRLGILTADRKTWVVRQVQPNETRKQPVLLNWPDTALVRGGEFHFKPVLSGGSQISADLIGRKDATAPVVADGGVSFRVREDELASLFMMAFKVPGKEAGELSYNIPLHLFGPQLPLVMPKDAATREIDSFGAGFKSLSASKEKVRTLPATRHVFSDPVEQVLGPVAGHLILVTSAQHVDFFSLQARKVVGSIASSDKAAYYTGAGALFEYDSATRALTRISVPDARREKNMTLPKGLGLHALAVGSDEKSPLTLILEQIKDQTVDRFGEWTLTTTQFDRNVVVLDSRTLQGAGWAQPKLWPDKDESRRGRNPFNAMGIAGGHPDKLPSSYSGQFITLPQVFIAVGNRLSLAARFPASRNNLGDLSSGMFPPTGSISGMTVANSVGTAFKGAIGDDFANGTIKSIGVTPCGRYRLVRIGSEGSADIIEVRTVENNRPLFRVGRLQLFGDEFKGMNEKIKQRAVVLSGTGPLMLLAGGGKALDLVDFDIPALAKEANPAEFHVTSQTAPCVMEGGTLEYQVETNNPNEVSVVRLRAEAAGASLSPTGLLRYSASQKVSEPTRVEISMEIESKDGQTVLHEFPVFVLPASRPDPKPKQEPDQRPSI